MSKRQNPKILYFRRPQPKASPYFVLIESSEEIGYHPFKTLDSALEFIEEREEDIRIRCSLYQNVPLVEDD